MTDILKINRAKWRAGSGGYHEIGQGPTELLNEIGFMCCLGFRCNQLGIPKRELLNESAPRYLQRKNIAELVKDNSSTPFCERAININDNERWTPEQREKLLKNHFAKKKIKVVFTGKYPIPK